MKVTMQVRIVSGQNTDSGVSAQRHVVGEGKSGEDDGGFDVIGCVHCFNPSCFSVLLLDKK